MLLIWCGEKSVKGKRIGELRPESIKKQEKVFWEVHFEDLRGCVSEAIWYQENNGKNKTN